MTARTRGVALILFWAGGIFFAILLGHLIVYGTNSVPAWLLLLCGIVNFASGYVQSRSRSR